MNNQELPKVQRNIPPITEVTPIYIKPRPGDDTAETEGKDDYLGIYLPYDSAEIVSGTADGWTLSRVSVTAPMQGITMFDGTSQTEDSNETNLNCLLFSSPKRIEIINSDAIDASPYLVFQEVIEKNLVVAWEIYAAVPFKIAGSPKKGSRTWQNAVSTEPVSIKQVQLFEDCNISIETPPPPIPGALFQKVTSRTISEVSIWR